MAKLNWKVDATLVSIIGHARAAKEFSPGYAEKAVPALFFVHDDGIYLMSAGIPGLLKEPGKPSHVVAYAQGYSPDVPHSWEKCREAVGGDDFGEALPLEWFTRALDAGAAIITLEVSAKQIRLSYVVRKSPKVAA